MNAKAVVLVTLKLCMILIISACATTAYVHAQDQVGKIKPDLLKAIVRINTSPDKQGKVHVGTGFLVSKEIVIKGITKRMLFLVTNKHMVGDWNLADRDIQEYYGGLDIFFYRTGDPSGSSYKSTRIDLKDASGKVKEFKLMIHPNPEIDVAIVSLDEELSGVSSIDLSSFDTSYLLKFDRITRQLTGLGDQVFAMGYPLGITSVKDNYPVAKTCILASPPGEELVMERPVLNRKGKNVGTRIQGKVLLIDGLIVPGNSGGPVILPSEVKIRRNPKTNQLEFSTEQIKNYIIGIVSSILGPSGLNIAYSSDYVEELIDLYLKAYARL